MRRLIIICFSLSLFACGQRENKSTSNLNAEPDSVSHIQFDPDGYYYSKDTLRYKQYELGRSALDFFIIDTKSKDKFKRRPKDSVFIAVNFRDTITNTEIRIKTTDFLITKDTLALQFHDNQIGNILVIGHFTGNKGPYYDNVEVFKTIVLKAKLIFKDTTFVTDFTWWEGD
ncbi:MAG: hypothetical protein JSS79_11540 [Bacteroidetes bacterium]|nr:hypothetical protein [Bacteroidota bacterium]